MGLTDVALGSWLFAACLGQTEAWCCGAAWLFVGRLALGTWVGLVSVSGVRRLCGTRPRRIALVWLVLASGSWLTGSGIGRISWSLRLAWMLPSGLSRFF